MTKEISKPEHDDTAPSTLFHALLRSDTLPASDKTLKRLRDEALIVVGAGTVTTSWALSVSTYHLLASPRILSKLKAELQASLPSDQLHVPLPQLERLPYLTAIIQEGLRLSYGVSSRLQRYSPDKDLVFNAKDGRSWVIPAGTPVGMTSVLLHHDETIFPDSHAFVPERWLDNPKLGKYLVAFSKGSRQCLGINLAYAEMYLTLSSIFRTFGSSGLRSTDQEVAQKDQGTLELYETSIKDVEIHADGFVPLPVDSSKGVRVRVRD